MSIVVRLLLAEIRCLLAPRFFLVDQRIKKGEIGKFGERKRGRLELDFSSYASIAGRSSIKIRQRDRGVNVSRVDPAFGRSFGEPRLDLHPIREEFLNACGCRSQQVAAFVVLD